VEKAEFVKQLPVFLFGYASHRSNCKSTLVRGDGLHKKVKILAGITPITSVAAARYMKTKIPNMDIPDEIIERLRKARNREEMIEEGIKIAVETINHLREIEGIAGIHIMTLQREELIPKICSAVGLYPRP